MNKNIFADKNRNRKVISLQKVSFENVTKKKLSAEGNTFTCLKGSSKKLANSILMQLLE